MRFELTAVTLVIAVAKGNDVAGPHVMRNAFKQFSEEVGDLQIGWAGEWNIKGASFRVYPMGQWFEPCKWDDYLCHQQIRGVQSLPPNLVGHHINSGVWLKSMQSYNQRVLLAWLFALACCVQCGYWLCLSCQQNRRYSACGNLSSVKPHPIHSQINFQGTETGVI